MLAIIPARGGSKGVPLKNIKLLNGKPLIYYTIAAAIESKLFEKVVVSTDDKNIVDVALEYGAEVPFSRPSSISGDAVSSDEVIKYVLECYKEKDISFDKVCKLQPTSPLRTAIHLREANQLFENKDADFVVSVCECEHSPLWCGRIDERLLLDDFCTEKVRLACRQKLDKYYRLNGAIYIAKTDSFMREGNFFGKNGYAYIMPQECSVDIDNETDFRIASMMLNDILRG